MADVVIGVSPTMHPLPFNIEPTRLAELCREHDVARLSVFGSALTDRFGPDSDVDMLVEFLPAARVTFLDIAGLELELTALIGRKVDLRTPRELSRHFRDRVLAEAVLQYAA
jgi:predicted nucleotidyltransferase